MASKKRPDWIKYFDSQTAEDRRTMALAAIERLMEIEEVSYINDDVDQDEKLIWDSCGEDLRTPF